MDDRAQGLSLPGRGYPETQALVDNSLCVCSELVPIYCQPARLIEQYADAIEKVFSDRQGLLRAAEAKAQVSA